MGGGEWPTQRRSSHEQYPVGHLLEPGIFDLTDHYTKHHTMAHHGKFGPCSSVEEGRAHTLCKGATKCLPDVANVG